MFGKRGTPALALAAVLALAGTALPALAGEVITGAGASFPFPVYSKWAAEYRKVSGMDLNYQSIGSGGGIRAIKDKTVDFGASDVPLKKEELAAAGLVQFPLVMGGVVAVVNVPGVKAGELRLTGPQLADIYLGRMAKWNDASLAAGNPGVKLPDLDIIVVRRADGSGTTYIFTNYLAAVSPEWKSSVGAGKEVQWPAGVGGKGNEGVAAMVKQTDGAIGYVEYAYALQNRMACTRLRNKAGNFVSPTDKSFSAAAAGADWKNAPGYHVILVDQPGEQSWPITGPSFILIPREIASASRARAMLGFFDWCYRKGGEIALQLDYVPIPPGLYSMIEETWKGAVTSGGRPVWP
jgi:phosphate transport system substrate-binding protein